MHNLLIHSDKIKSTFCNEIWKVFMTSVCLSAVRTITSVNIFCSQRNSRVNRCHPSMFPIENCICSCYTFATGPFKRNPIHYGQWAIFSWKWILVMLIYLNTKNSICRCYTFATGPFKRNQIYYGQWAIFLKVNSCNFNLKWTVCWLNRKL